MGRDEEIAMKVSPQMLISEILYHSLRMPSSTHMHNFIIQLLEFYL